MSITSIITVNYNQPTVTNDLLCSLQKYAPEENIEVILVDNAPDEDHQTYFRNNYEGLIYLKSQENLGFAGGNNLGISSAKGDYILLLNNDTEITLGFIDTMVNEMEKNPEIGLLSPLIKYWDDKNVIQYAGFTGMNYFTARNKGIGSFEEDKGQYDNQSRETGFCHGAAVMCRKADLDKAGLMDENYFLYYEEFDWCEKFKNIGKKIWFTGKTFIYHKESMSVGKESAIKTYFMTRNRILYIRKNASRLTIILFTIYYIMFALPKQLLKYLVNGRNDLARQTLRGLCWNAVNDKNSRKLGYQIK